MRLIDADALQVFIDRNSDNLTKDWSSGAVMLAVDSQPTVDAVEVVMCKDCIWHDNVLKLEDGDDVECNLHYMSMPQNGFCSDGFNG